jgi:DNA-binding response OmpR family regulator
MHLESLLISRDVAVHHVVRPTLERLSISVEVCSAARSGAEILLKEKFDAVIVDCDDLQGGEEVLRGLRHSPSNKNSVAFAILNGKTTTQKAFEMGANFVLQKPLTPLNATRCFNAALSFMERERRRYFRCPVEMNVLLVFSQGTELKATTTNISEGGMAVRFRGELPKEAISKVQFTLLETNISLESKAEIAWSDGLGRAGLRFLELAKSSHHQLETWLGERMEKALISKMQTPPASPPTVS